MNYQDLNAAKKAFEQLAGLCDTMGNSGLWDKPDNLDTTLRDILQCDVAQFIMYLSASDGQLSAEEIQAYRFITGFGGDDLSSIKRHIEECKIYSMDFESEPPLIMKILSECERRALSCGIDLHTSVLKIVASTYRLIGTVIISIDGGITYNEKRDFKIIMGTIEGFANDHDISGDSWSLLN